jgi:glycosyltransferase involved in cell wall biosynthesis
MKRILFFSQICYLDFELEYLRQLTNCGYEVSVLIELPESQRETNILKLSRSVDFKKLNCLVDFNDVKIDWDIEYLEYFFRGCSSVHFVIYSSNCLVTLSRTVLIQWKFIRALEIDFFHFDDISARNFFLLPFIIKNRKRILFNVHDPKPHSGEFEWKRYLLKRIFYTFFNKFMVFSEFSRNQLAGLIGMEKKIFVHRLSPYSVYREFIPEGCDDQTAGDTIAFVGRISEYKGIDLLLKVIRELQIALPKLRFVIGGKLVDGFEISDDSLKDLENLDFIDRHLKNEEIVGIIMNSQLVVCPYREATQSGVIMTSLALNRPVMVSNVGALPEYIQNGITGVLVEDYSVESWKKAILEFVLQGKAQFMITQLKSNFNELNHYYSNDKSFSTVYSLDVN